MLFNSIEYLLFLPVVFLVYWKLCYSVKAKNVWIILSSYFFYAWWDWRFTGLLALTTLASYASSIAIEHLNKLSRKSRARIVLAANIVLNVGILCVFKYYDFFAESFCDLVQSIGFERPTFPLLNVILPVGISFYTFHAVSYCIDVPTPDSRRAAFRLYGSRRWNASDSVGIVQEGCYCRWLRRRC